LVSDRPGLLGLWDGSAVQWLR